MLYKEIPVTHNGEIKYFNFDTLGEDAAEGYRVWSGLEQMKVDNNLMFDGGDMSTDWIQPAIDMLRQILGKD